jgi:hypothetical protein
MKLSPFAQRRCFSALQSQQQPLAYNSAVVFSALGKRVRSAALLLSLSALTACGGGGDNTVQEDVLPDAFVFTAVRDAFLNSPIESNSITVQGINTAVAVSIVGGEYAIDGGEYSNVAATVTAGQTIKVRVTSADALEQPTQTTLSIGAIDATFAATTRTAEPSGLFTGMGSVNGGTNNLVDLKGMISNEHFMLFTEADNVLYDGHIQSYSEGSFSATVDLYKDGVNSQSVNATGTIVNQTTISLALTGTGYGTGTIDLIYNALFERAATQARFSASFPYIWLGDTHTVNSGQVFGLNANIDSNAFTGGPAGTNSCKYTNGIKTIPETEFNFYLLNFDVEDTLVPTCDHVGNDYQGFATVIDGGSRGTDGIMWFAASNGVNSSFSILEYQQ